MPFRSFHGSMPYLWACFCLCLAAAGCNRSISGAPGELSSDSSQALSPVAALGRQIFFDDSLSASGKVACATCHNPRFAYGPPDGRAVRFGGADLKSPGTRTVPSLRYTLDRAPRWAHVRAYSEVERLTETDDAPAGGFAWDGRFDGLHAQAMVPLFVSNEMANRDASDFATKLFRAHYADSFKAVFGKDIFKDPDLAVEKATYALERFEIEDKSFHPYSSKFDAWMDGKASLTAQELRGKQLFDNPDRGNCASCHRDDRGADGSHPVFTDFQFEALGVPRNLEIPANQDPTYFDMGLCGPLRTDAASKNPTYCGLFKTPTLRNVTIRRAFFHNGRFHTLREALRFYVQRDTNPERWYPVDKNGQVLKYDDLPRRYHSNIDIIDPPLNLGPGQSPAWSDPNIDDVIAFLRTLEDSDVAEAAK